MESETTKRNRVTDQGRLAEIEASMVHIIGKKPPETKKGTMILIKTKDTDDKFPASVSIDKHEWKPASGLDKVASKFNMAPIRKREIIISGVVNTPGNDDQILWNDNTIFLIEEGYKNGTIKVIVKSGLINFGVKDQPDKTEHQKLDGQQALDLFKEIEKIVDYIESSD